MFEGCSERGCACGVHPDLLVDEAGNRIPYVALNVQNTDIRDEKLARPLGDDQMGNMGMYHDGRNCGRWVSIRFGDACANARNDPFADPPLVCGRDARSDTGVDADALRPDQYTGTEVFAVVADSCQDGNFWCREDPYHLDLSEDLVLRACGGARECAHTRMLTWNFVDRPPPIPYVVAPVSPRFAWHCTSDFPWYNVLVVHTLRNGVSAVLVDGLSAVANRDNWQQWALPPFSIERGVNDTVPDQNVTVDVRDVDGASYGNFTVPLDPAAVRTECAISGTSYGVVDAPFIRDRPGPRLSNQREREPAGPGPMTVRSRRPRRARPSRPRSTRSPSR